MYRILVVVNLSLAGISAAFFASTFAARGQMIDLAKNYVADRTRPKADRLAAAAEAGLRSAAGRWLPDRVRDAVRRELDAYADDPVGTIRRWAADAAEADPPAAGVPAQDAVVRWRDRVKAQYDAAYAGLIRDLRIFSGSNVVAGLLAAWLAARARGPHRYRIAALSVILLAAVCVLGSSYINHMSVFDIVTGRYTGWGYPGFLAMSVIYVWFKVVRMIPPAPCPN